MYYISHIFNKTKLFQYPFKLAFQFHIRIRALYPFKLAFQFHIKISASNLSCQQWFYRIFCPGES